MEQTKKKPTYEELERYCNYLTNQMDEMSEKLKQMQFSEMIARLNFEFKVLELAKQFPKEYVDKCSEDIQRVLVMESPEGENQTNNEENND